MCISDRTCPSTHTSWWPIRLQAGHEVLRSNRALRPAIRNLPDDMTWFSDGVMILTSLSSTVGWWSAVNTRLGVPDTSLHTATYSGIDNFEWSKKLPKDWRWIFNLFWVKLDLAEVCENGIFHNVGFLIRRSSSCWEYGSWILGQWYHCFTGRRRRAAETWLRDVNKTLRKIDMNTCNQSLSGLPTSVGLKSGETYAHRADVIRGSMKRLHFYWRAILKRPSYGSEFVLRFLEATIETSKHLLSTRS